MTEEAYKKLQSLIAIGEELNFYYKNDEYWISYGRDGESYLARSRDHYTQEFSNYEELFEKATIEGIKISEIYPKITWG
ncbi:hypothetical protein [Lysinibacillus piscis]|uniref:Uncharacterized protein n=1 Tax=Lysinibacillus piscis TaxID=2518931 RepID=A0ABQ5NJD2_9BACI|nr:hypothetical protein [Lysinibacillus sp. KH24]GLC88468.1 hypothetical protein LYSBPC_15950 [Lysinibacillus sp. KH24]